MPARRFALIALSCALWCSLAASGCGETAGDSAIDDARQRWEDQDLHDYELVYEARGFDPQTPFGPVRLTVVQDVVVAAVPLDSSRPAPEADQVDDFPTVDDLFDRIAFELTQPSVETTVRYDDALDYPTEAWFDVGEEGDGFTASELTPSPSPE